jgi:hypothetical protein
MAGESIEPGRFAREKTGDTDDPGHPQPSEPEVESARLLENDARDALRVRGFADDEIRRLADEYVALDLGEDTDEFVLWAQRNRGEAH